MSSRPIRFGYGSSGPTGAAVVEHARRAEALGYSIFQIPDHLLDQPAPLVALTAVATATERIRVGTFVLNNDLRHPAVLAQELATLDVLSGGRLEVGLGAGWNRPEYERAGIDFDPPGVRIDRMVEAIKVLKGLFGEGELTFQGRHYRITGLDGRPKPVQAPHPPFLIGGGGPRLLTIAGREAQMISLARFSSAPPAEGLAGCMVEGTRRKIEIVRRAAKDRFAEIEIGTYASLSPVVITSDPRSAARELGDRWRKEHGLDLDEATILASPHVFIGTVDQLAEKCLWLRDSLGISCFTIFNAHEEFAGVIERVAGR